MRHVTDRQSGAFTVLGFYSVAVLVLTRCCDGRSEVVGPSRPIVALVGDDVVLPCRLVPVADASAMTVEWARRDLEPRFVLLWRGGVDLANRKHPAYRGRTTLSADGLQRGDASLELSSVRTSDEGSYRCFIPELDGSPAVRLVVDPSFIVPGTPGTPGTPATPSTPSTPGTPGTPGTPATPGTRSTAARPHVIIGSIIGCTALVFIPAVLFVVWKWQQKKFNIPKKSLEDGGKEVTSSQDNTGSQDGECASLLAGKEEDSRREKIESHSETHQDQLVTKPDEDTAERESKLNSIRHEGEPLIPTEVQTQQKQDVVGRQVANEGEGRQTVEPVEEDSGLPLALVEDRREERHRHVHAAQEGREEEETNQEPASNKVDEEDAKKKVDSGCTEPENRGERRPPKAEIQSLEYDRKRQQKSCPLGDKKQESGAAQEDARVEDQEAKQNEGKEENRKETEDVQNEKKLQSEEQENIQKNKKTRKGVGDQTRDAIKDREGRQSGTERTTGRKPENQEETSKKSEKTDPNTQEGVLDASKQEAVNGDEKGRNTTSRSEGNPENQEKTSKESEKTDPNTQEGVLDASKQEAVNGDEKGRNTTSRSEGNPENQEKTSKESEKTDPNTQEGVLDASKQEAVHGDEKGRNTTSRSEGNPENQEKTSKESEKTDPNTQEGVLDASKQEAVHGDEKRRNTTSRSEGNPENQEKTSKESEKTDPNTQEGVLDASKQEAVNGDEKGRNTTSRTEGNPENRTDERGTERPSAGREFTRKPNLKIHRGTTARRKPKLHEDPEVQREEECEEGPEERMETNEGADNSGSDIKKPPKRRRGREEDLHEAERPSKRTLQQPKGAQVEVLEDVNMEQEVDEPQGRASNSEEQMDQ